MASKSHDLTHGPLARQIILFSLPLMATNVLQVLFNMSDVAVVGQFAGPEALGSVGSTSILVSLFTGFLIGMGCGVNVRMARELGARRRESVIKTVHSAFVICLIVGLLVGAACFFFAEGLLGILHTKEELMDSAVLYLKIYALGMPGMALYNCGNGILSATGDTKPEQIKIRHSFWFNCSCITTIPLPFCVKQQSVVLIRISIHLAVSDTGKSPCTS